jgi:hypothetical protein
MHAGTRNPPLGEILFTLARAFAVGLAAAGGASIVAFLGRILDRLTGGVLVAVAGVLDQLALGFFEALGFAAPTFHDRAVGFVGLFLGGWLGAGASADRRRFGGGSFGFLLGSIRCWHDEWLTRAL